MADFALVLGTFFMFHNNVIFKGQEISDGNFGVFNFQKKTNEIYLMLSALDFLLIRSYLT